MLLVNDINNYNNQNIFFCDPVNNSIMHEGKFIRILYSTSNVVLNGIYLFISFNEIANERTNKYKYTFNTTTENNIIINNLKNIEKNILDKYQLYQTNDKIPQYKIYEQLNNGYLKLFFDIKENTNCSFILKISGIWENNDTYGLTYKFIK